MPLYSEKGGVQGYSGVLSSAGLGPLEMEENQGQGQVRVKVTTTLHSIQKDSLRWEGLGCGQNT